MRIFKNAGHIKNKYETASNLMLDLTARAKFNLSLVGFWMWLSLREFTGRSI